jgi:hypothetical protein
MPAEALSLNTSGKKLTDFVWVGCKLPHGLWLEHIPVPNSDARNWNPGPKGPRVRLNGANKAQTNQLLLVTPRVHDYGRTQVDRSFWERWLAANKDMDAVKKGFIFAEEKKDDFKAHRNECLPEKTGLEGLTPDGDDERIKKIEVPGLTETKVETDKEHLARLRSNMVEVEA